MSTKKAATKEIKTTKKQPPKIDVHQIADVKKLQDYCQILINLRNKEKLIKAKKTEIEAAEKVVNNLVEEKQKIEKERDDLLKDEEKWINDALGLSDKKEELPANPAPLTTTKTEPTNPVPATKNSSVKPTSTSAATPNPASATKNESVKAVPPADTKSNTSAPIVFKTPEEVYRESKAREKAMEEEDMLGF